MTIVISVVIVSKAVMSKVIMSIVLSRHGKKYFLNALDESFTRLFISFSKLLADLL